MTSCNLFDPLNDCDLAVTSFTSIKDLSSEFMTTMACGEEGSSC